MKIKEKRYRSLMLELLISNLIATRKLCDFILNPISKVDPEAVIPKVTQFRNEINDSTQRVLEKLLQKS